MIWVNPLIANQIVGGASERALAPWGRPRPECHNACAHAGFLCALSSIRARVRVSTRAATHARSGGAPSSVRCGRRPPPPQSRLARGCQYCGSTWGSRPRSSLWETGLALQAYISQTSNIEHNPAARRRGGWGRGSLLRYWGLCVSSIGTRVCGYAGK